MELTCEKCQRIVKWLTEAEAKWVGPECVPEARWKMYPGWKEREELRNQRAMQAKANFSK